MQLYRIVPEVQYKGGEERTVYLIQYKWLWWWFNLKCPLRHRGEVIKEYYVEWKSRQSALAYLKEEYPDTEWQLVECRK